MKARARACHLRFFFVWGAVFLAFACGDRREPAERTGPSSDPQPETQSSTAVAPASVAPSAKASRRGWDIDWLPAELRAAGVDLERLSSVAVLGGQFVSSVWIPTQVMVEFQVTPGSTDFDRLHFQEGKLTGRKPVKEGHGRPTAPEEAARKIFDVKELDLGAITKMVEDATKTLLLYRLVLAPHVWRMTQRVRYRTFVDLTLREVLVALLENRSMAAPGGAGGLASSGPVEPPSGVRDYFGYRAPRAGYRFAVGEDVRLDDPHLGRACVILAEARPLRPSWS